MKLYRVIEVAIRLVGEGEMRVQHVPIGASFSKKVAEGAMQEREYKPIHSIDNRTCYIDSIEVDSKYLVTSQTDEGCAELAEIAGLGEPLDGHLADEVCDIVDEFRSDFE